MEAKEVIEALKKARTESKKRNFSQRFDVIVNLKNLDFKKPDNQIDMFVNYHYGLGKEKKICALVGPELKDEAKKVCDLTISVDDFQKYVDNKHEFKKIANEYDFFIAQANIMPKVASSFGRILGPKNKMPNPKAGCVVPPKASLQPLYDRLQKTNRITAKKEQYVQVGIGSEDMKDEDIADNVMTLYSNLINTLPNDLNNIKNIFIKLTMGKPVKVA